MSRGPKGKLIIIGGHEEKFQEGKRTILKHVAEQARGKGPLVITSVASTLPDQEWETYCQVFHDLGVEDVSLLGLKTREDGFRDEVRDKISTAAVVFFTGGDQLRITSQVGDTPVFRCLQEIYEKGATIAGTSAGAAAMPETMIFSGSSEESYQISALSMAPGLGFVRGVVIDSHFAQRGRFGRLLGAIAENPKNLGIGIDENTAIEVATPSCFTVLGTGAVYVVDGSLISYSSLSEEQPEGVASIFGVKMHVLAEGDSFDFEQRRPSHSDLA
jgi:cyanophycinase